MLRIIMVVIAINLLTRKINIVLEININSFSPSKKVEGTSDFKTLSKFYQ